MLTSFKTTPNWMLEFKILKLPTFRICVPFMPCYMSSWWHSRPPSKTVTSRFPPRHWNTCLLIDTGIPSARSCCARCGLRKPMAVNQWQKSLASTNTIQDSHLILDGEFLDLQSNAWKQNVVLTIVKRYQKGHFKKHNQGFGPGLVQFWLYLDSPTIKIWNANL